MPKIPVSEIDKKVGKRIQQARREKKLTVAKLSETTDLPAQTISRYERGENKINLEHLTLISRALMMPISWFLIDEEQSYQADCNNMLKQSKQSYYSSQNDLKMRLLQRWNMLTIEQKRALIILLDTI